MAVYEEINVGSAPGIQTVHFNSDTGTLLAYQHIDARPGGLGRLSRFPGLPANYASGDSADKKNPPIRPVPPTGPFDGCVPGWRVAWGFGLIFLATIHFIWSIRHSYGWMAFCSYGLFLVGSLIWLTGHTCCEGSEQYNDPQILQHDGENVSQKLFDSG
jgi:hypothetical protein